MAHGLRLAAAARGALALCALAGLLAGCKQSISEPGDGADSARFLRLQGYTIVDRDTATLEGFLRWIYVADEPSEDDTQEQEPLCQTWELLQLSATTVDANCLDCTDQWTGTATVDSEASDCSDVDWSSRGFTLASQPIESASEGLSIYAADGFTHGVRTKWSPETGDSQGFQDLFVAEPQLWASDQPDPIGTGAGEPPAGQYHLYCVSYWQLNSADSAE